MRIPIVFVINSIGYGGAERVLRILLDAAGAERDRYDIHLVLLDDQAEVREMPDFVVKHVLDGRGSLVRSLWQLYRLLRRLRPALIVSFLVRANVSSAIVGRLLATPVIVCERMHLSSHLEGRYRGVQLLAARLMPRLAYRFATIVLGVSTGVTEDLVRHFDVNPHRARTIFNPYDIDAIGRAAQDSPEMELPARFIVAVGRIEPSKNLHQLVEALAASGLPHTLVILGEGSQRGAIARAAAEAGVADRLILPGYVANPFPIIARAEYYASSSRNEGFPNALVEALALGKAVVATDCASGPAEILAGVAKLDRPGVTEAEYGILVEEGSVEVLAEALARMADPNVRRNYEALARRRAECFGLREVAAEYWALFDEAVAGGDGKVRRRSA